jgi:hypothetical protein
VACPGGSLTLEGYVSRCPSPCAKVDKNEVLESMVTAHISTKTFQTAVSAVVGNKNWKVRSNKHITIFAISLPGKEEDYDNLEMQSDNSKKVINGVSNLLWAALQRAMCSFGGEGGM